MGRGFGRSAASDGAVGAARAWGGGGRWRTTKALVAVFVGLCGRASGWIQSFTGEPGVCGFLVASDFVAPFAVGLLVVRIDGEGERQRDAGGGCVGAERIEH